MIFPFDLYKRINFFYNFNIPVEYGNYYCVFSGKYFKSFIAKWVISIFVNMRYLRMKLLKYKENNKKICGTFDQNFKYIPLYIIS